MVKEKLRAITKDNAALSQAALLHRLNPVIRGWAHFYRHVVSKRTFCDVDYAIWRMTWNWARRRHPNKRTEWVKDRYYRRREEREWVLTDGKTRLFLMSSLSIQRHFPLRGEANPYDREWAAYFQHRCLRTGPRQPHLPAWMASQ